MQKNGTLLIAAAVAAVLLLKGKLGRGVVTPPASPVGVQRIGVQAASAGSAAPLTAGEYVAYPGESLVTGIAGTYVGPAQSVRVRHIPSTAPGSAYASSDTLGAWFRATYAAHPDWFQEWTVPVAGTASAAAFSTTSPAYSFASGGTVYGIILELTLSAEGTTFYVGARDRIRVVVGSLSGITIS